MKISCAIITLNEEKNIERCIRSVEGIVDDIVVIDSYSTDRTREICEKLNVRFIENPFEDTIQQKNFSFTQTKYPYVLSLDADEALSEELKESILEVKENWTADGYYFNRLTNYCGKWIKHCGWYPDHKLRLLDTRQGQFVGIKPHDVIKMKEKTTIQYLKGDLLHYSYYEISEHINQFNIFTEIGAKAAVENGRKINLLKIICFPIWKFFRDYFIKLGFLDGYYGFVICIISAHASFIKYVKMKELTK